VVVMMHRLVLRLLRILLLLMLLVGLLVAAEVVTLLAGSWGRDFGG
jgi:hypothetical protein